MPKLVNGFTQWKEKRQCCTGAVRPPQGQELHLPDLLLVNHQTHGKALSLGGLWGGMTSEPSLGIRCLGLRESGTEQAS